MCKVMCTSLHWAIFAVYTFYDLEKDGEFFTDQWTAAFFFPYSTQLEIMTLKAPNDLP